MIFSTLLTSKDYCMQANPSEPEIALQDNVTYYNNLNH